MGAPSVAAAGASAAREGERRGRGARRRRIAATAAGLGGVAAGVRLGVAPAALAAAAGGSAAIALWPTRAGRWAAGAAGERATARALAGVEAEGWTVLHDVRLPGRRWNLDHVLLGPAGVVLVETKQWRRPVTVRRRWPQVVEEKVGWQLDAVAAALRAHGHPDVTVHGFVCVHGARVRRPWWWPGARRAPIGDARHLRRWLRRLPRSAIAGHELGRKVFEVHPAGERP